MEKSANAHVSRSYSEQTEAFRGQIPSPSYKRIAILGAGVVGSATASGLAPMGHAVKVYDIDRTKLSALAGNGIRAVDSVDEAVAESEVIMICVPTPTVGGRCDLQHLTSAAAAAGRAMGRGHDYQIVVIRSTVLPSAIRKIIIPVLELASAKVLGQDFGVCANPEFLRESSPLEDFLEPDRIVIGESDPRAGDILEELYLPLAKPIVRCSLEEAELIKYISNGFLAAKISFFNETHEVCVRLGVNPRIVERGVALDGRIGPYGTTGGRPFGGSCLLKDLEAFVTFAREVGVDASMLGTTLRVNQSLAPGGLKVA